MKRKKERTHHHHHHYQQESIIFSFVVKRKREKVVAEKYLVSTVLPYGDYNNNILLHTKPSPPPLHFS